MIKIVESNKPSLKYGDLIPGDIFKFIGNKSNIFIKGCPHFRSKELINKKLYGSYINVQTGEIYLIDDDPNLINVDVIKYDGTLSVY